MPIVGSAYVVIRALTDQLEKDITSSLNKTTSSNNAGTNAGKAFGDSFLKGYKNQIASGSGGDPLEALGRDITRDAGQIGEDAGRELVDGLNSIEPDANNSGRGIGSSLVSGVLSGLSGGSGAISGFLVKLLTFGPAITAAVGAISALISGLFALVSAASAAAAGLVVIPSVLSAIVQGIATVGFAFQGIGAAYKAGTNAAAKAAAAGAGAASSAENSAHRIRNAREAVQKAEETAADAIVAAQKRIKNAQDALDQANKTQKEDIAQAAKNVADAERNYKDAIEASRDAQKAINDARAEAIVRLRDLQFQLRQGAISEGDAALALQRAQAAYARVLELPVNNPLRQEALLNLQQAQLNVDEAKANNEDLAKAQQKADKQGVEGSDEVVKAKKNAADAARQQKDAEDAVTKARKDQDQSKIDDTKRVTAAQEELNDAIKDEAKVRRDAARSVRDAKEALDAAGTSAGAAAKAFNAYQAQLDALSPSARHFVEFLISIRGEMKSLREAAGVELFPKLENAIQRLVTGLFPQLRTTFRETGSAIGDLAIKASLLATSGPFKKDFQAVADQNVKTISLLGEAGLKLADAFVHILAVASPLIEIFDKFILQQATLFDAYIKSKKGTDDLKNAFANAHDVAKTLGDIFANIGVGLFKLGKLAFPAGKSLLDSFDQATKHFRELTDAPGKAAKFKKFFDETAENTKRISSLLAEIGKAFLELGDDPIIGQIADRLKESVPALRDAIQGITDTLGPQLADLFGNIVDIIKKITEGNGLVILLNVLNAIALGFKAILDNKLGFQVVIVLLGLKAALTGLQIGAKVTGLEALAKAMKKVVDAGKVDGKGPGAIARALKIGGGGAGAAGAAEGVIAGEAGAAAGGVEAAGAGLAASLGPFIIAAAVIAALVGAFILLYTHSKAFHDFINNKLVPVLKGTFLGVINTVKDVFGSIGDAFKNNQESFDKVGKILATIGNILVKFVIPAIGEWLKAYIKIEGFIAVFLINTIAKLIDVIAGIVEVSITVVRETIKVFGKLISFFAGLFKLVSEAVSNPFGFIVDAAQAAVSLVSTVFEGLITVIKALAKRFASAAGDVFGWLKTKIHDALKYIEDRVVDIVKAIGTIPSKILKANVDLFKFLRDKIVAARDYVEARFGDLITFVGSLPAKFAHAVSNVFGFLGDQAKAARDRATGFIQQIVDFLRNSLPHRIADAAKGAFKGLTNAFIDAINGMINVWNNLEFKLPKVDSHIPGLGKIGGFTLGTPNIQTIPRLAKGADILATPGGVLVRAAEAGQNERVKPLDADGFSKDTRAIFELLKNQGAFRSITQIVKPSPGMDERELARLSGEELAWQLKLGTG